MLVSIIYEQGIFVRDEEIMTYYVAERIAHDATGSERDCHIE